MIRNRAVSPRILYLVGAGVLALVLLSAIDSCSANASADAIEWKARAEFAEARRKQAVAQRDSAIARYRSSSADVDRVQVRHSSAAAAVRARPELMADSDVAELVAAGEQLSRVADTLQVDSDDAIAAGNRATAATDSVTIAVRGQLEAERRAARPRLTASASLLWDFLHQVPVVRTAVNLRLSDRLQLVAGAEAAGPGVNGIEARLTAGTTYNFR